MKSVLEVEIKTPNSGNVYFGPYGDPLRGAMDLLRASLYDQQLSSQAVEFPRGLPGKHVRVNLDAGTVTIVEPLDFPEWADERNKLEARGKTYKPDQEIPSPRISDWLHELKRCLDCGCARLVSGKLPDDLGQESPHEFDRNQQAGSKADDNRMSRIEESMANLQDAVAMLARLVAEKK